MYGLPIFEGKEGAELQRQLDNHELTLGGCVVSPDSPKVATTCLVCGFSYSQENDSWFRFSADPDSFVPPISPLLRSLHPPDGGSPSFYQELDHDKVMHESVEIVTKAPMEEVTSYVQPWLKTAGLSSKPEGHLQGIHPDRDWFAIGKDRLWDLSIRKPYGGGSELSFTRAVTNYRSPESNHPTESTAKAAEHR